MQPRFHSVHATGSVARMSCFAGLALAALAEGHVLAQAQSNQPPVLIVEIEQGSKVEVSRGGRGIWDPAYTNQVLLPKDLLRTGPRSRAALRLSDQSLFRVGELSDLEIQPPSEKKAQASFNLLKGLLYFLHSEKVAGFRINTRTASAAIRGTEFNLEVTEQGQTILSLINVAVQLS